MRKETLTIILAGGVGSRLKPLTKERTKPAVPFGAKFRIIDFTLSNCLHSGLRRVLVLTQYKSLSLQNHLRDAWSIFNPELGEYITPVPPQMRTGNHWYWGTADAVYQNLYLLKRSGARWVLILSGDHIYRMDYAALLNIHREKAADLTVASMAVPLQEAKAFGVLSVDAERRIVAFEEKPQHPKPLPDNPDQALVSMGIYVFSLKKLILALEKDASNPHSSHDFGKDIIPHLIDNQSVFAYLFGTSLGRVTPDRYWRDVGTIDSYYEANMDLLKPMPPSTYISQTGRSGAIPHRIPHCVQPLVAPAMKVSSSIHWLPGASSFQAAKWCTRFYLPMYSLTMAPMSKIPFCLREPR